MSLTFRSATRDDVPAIVALLADDPLGAQRETGGMADYLAAFDRIAADANSQLVVGEQDGRVVATYHLNILHGLSLRAASRAQVESVRVAADLRSRGVGAALMADAEARARAAGCRLIQLTTHKSRGRAHAFYDRLGFTASHIGYKRSLDPEGEH
ncbi:GNAT family N-acetyltransferase [Acidimangrovimonas pyrenivorans]|uniref:GNAT family N-acetyltransferase n=1 Tax=Acidimangrovimonas pyrenivorans TaxID=2030798 RepID=A0ABV7AK01_9RHOB